VLHDPRAHPPRMVAAGARARAGLGSRVLSCSGCIACPQAGRATLSRHVMSPHVQTFVLKVLRNGSSRYILYPCRFACDDGRVQNAMDGQASLPPHKSILSLQRRQRSTGPNCAAFKPYRFKRTVQQLILYFKNVG